MFCLQQLEQLQKELNFLEEDIKRVEVKPLIVFKCKRSRAVHRIIKSYHVVQRWSSSSQLWTDKHVIPVIFQEMSGLYSPMMEAECTVPNVEAPSPAPRYSWPLCSAQLYICLHHHSATNHTCFFVYQCRDLFWEQMAFCSLNNSCVFMRSYLSKTLTFSEDVASM